MIWRRLLILTAIFSWIVSVSTVVKAADEPSVKKSASADAEPAAEHGGGSHGEGGGDENPNILEPSPPLAIWTLVVFLVLLGGLWKFAWKPLSKALHDRETYHETLLRDAENARAESARLLEEHRKRMDAAADEVRALIEQGRKDATAAADAIVRKAQEDAESARRQAKQEIFAARDQALMEIWSKTADLAVSVAGKVLARDLGADDHRRLLAAAVEELPRAGSNAAGRNGA